ncbi:unnamed protein product [Fusarium equiseti]|uniref:Uncharacterized protein n=1 Tax=Fusarium equiseti TaxID=61235 RepID=A0A8J2IYB3_FUSEQ|nr:unnamed protein product [Fusarium equiseti]
MSQKLPTTIDANTTVTWPENLPPTQPEKAPVFNDVPGNALPDPHKPDGRHWTEIMAESAARLPVVRRMSVRRRAEHFYSHLTNSTIDWELDAPHTACRVVGMGCYGRDCETESALAMHLDSEPHRQHAASLAKAQPSVPKQATDEQTSSAPPK